MPLFGICSLNASPVGENTVGLSCQKFDERKQKPVKKQDIECLKPGRERDSLSVA